MAGVTSFLYLMMRPLNMLTVFFFHYPFYVFFTVNQGPQLNGILLLSWMTQTSFLESLNPQDSEKQLF